MRSYIEILKELQQTVDSDSLPTEERMNINKIIMHLVNLLWQWSD